MDRLTCGIFLILLMSTSVLSQMNISEGLKQDLFNVLEGMANSTQKMTNTPVTRDNLHFTLYRIDPNIKTELTSQNLNLLANTKGKIAIFTHGWTDSGRAQWLLDMKDAFLSKNADSAVILLDWSKYAAEVYYVSAIDVHDVGNFVGDLINELVDKYKLNINQFLVSGHSLGGQIAGFTGKRLKEYQKVLPRIIALDPAGPLFVGRPEAERLNPTDAEVVTVLHTNGATFGYKEPCGTIDIFANGGDHQVGCNKLSVTDISQALDPFVCDHERAYKYLTEAILHPSHFEAKKCLVWTLLSKVCDEDDTVTLGDFSTKKFGKYYFKTNKEWPYSISLHPAGETALQKMARLLNIKPTNQ